MTGLLKEEKLSIKKLTDSMYIADDWGWKVKIDHKINIYKVKTATHKLSAH